MTTRPIDLVLAPDGPDARRVRARRVVCAHCGDDRWLIDLIAGRRHLTCYHCGTIYCDHKGPCLLRPQE